MTLCLHGGLQCEANVAKLEEHCEKIGEKLEYEEGKLAAHEGQLTELEVRWAGNLRCCKGMSVAAT